MDHRKYWGCHHSSSPQSSYHPPTPADDEASPEVLLFAAWCTTSGTVPLPALDRKWLPVQELLCRLLSPPLHGGGNSDGNFSGCTNVSALQSTTSGYLLL